MCTNDMHDGRFLKYASFCYNVLNTEKKNLRSYFNKKKLPVKFLTYSFIAVLNLKCILLKVVEICS